MAANILRVEKLLPALLLLYAAASLVHYTHNAEFLRDYPNMPSGLSRAQVYIAWIAVTAIGACGYALWRRGRSVLGLSVMAGYAALGFDGLVHYVLAPFRDHSVTMHLIIGLEVVAAAMLLAAVGRAAIHE
jgi:hypothetical protein